MMTLKINVLALLATALAAGCAIPLPRSDVLAESGISARTLDEHLQVAAWYDERAAEYRTAAEQHRIAPLQERRTWDYLGLRRSYQEGPSIMRSHCKSLTSAYLQAEEEARGAAARHRLAAQR